VGARRARAERVADGERPVDEAGLGRDHLDVEQAVLVELLERENRLESGDAAAGDQDAERGGGHGSSVLRSQRLCIRSFPAREGWSAPMDPYSRARRLGAMDEPIITTVDLTKVYGRGATEVRALDGVDFAVAAGEFVAIMG